MLFTTRDVMNTRGSNNIAFKNPQSYLNKTANDLNTIDNNCLHLQNFAFTWNNPHANTLHTDCVCQIRLKHCTQNSNQIKSIILRQSQCS